MVDADSHLKLLPTTILDTYNVIEHIDIAGGEVSLKYL
jgi:hypothetical protein